MKYGRVCLSFLLLLAPLAALAVDLPPGDPFRDTFLPGTTVSAHPEQAGVVLEDVLLPYSFSGAGAVVSGVVQNRVVRSDLDGTLYFYWRIIPNASSTGGIEAFRVGGFAGFVLDGDWAADGLGNIPPRIARNFGNGSVNFLFTDPTVRNTDSSRFFFLHTRATSYTLGGQYDLLCAPNGCISPSFSTFVPTSGPPPISTTVDIATTPSPLVEGQPATFRFTVTSASAGPSPLTGRVELLDGATAIDSSPVDANGQATVTLPSVPAGNHSFAGRYTGDRNYAPSVSPVITTPISTTVDITALPFPLVEGQPATFRFTVTSASAGASPLTGRVELFDGSTPIGSSPVDANGQATVTLPSVPAGNHAYAGRYTGDQNYAPAVSPVITVTVIPLISTSVSIKTTPIQLVEGQPATFEFTVTSASAGASPLTGRVELLDGPIDSTPISSSPVDANGQATVTLPRVPAGNHFYAGRYTGDQNHAPAVSAAITLNRTSNVVLARCPDNAAADFQQCAGTPDKLAATVLPSGNTIATGTVALRQDGLVLETQSLVNGRADFMTRASTPDVRSRLVVEYSGDPNYGASTSNPLSDAIQIGDVVLTSEPSPAVAGQAARFTATTISGNPVPNANYTFRVDGRQIAVVPDSANGNAVLDYSSARDETSLNVVRTPAGTDGQYPASREAAQKFSTPDATGGGSCFIATAAYGSHLHPHVQTLRDFRDRVLMTNRPGRSFVAAYYEYSPALARWIEQDPTSRAAARVALTPIVLAVAYPGCGCALLLVVLLAVRHRRAVKERRGRDR